MKCLVFTLLICSLASGAAAQAVPKAPAAAKKALKAEITRVTPPGLQSGAESLWTITGKNLEAVGLQVMSSHPALKAQIVPKSIKPTTARVRVMAGAELPRGKHEVWLKNEAGESAKLKVFADDLPITTQPGKAESLPASLWGTLTATGQHDAWRFQARAGEELVLDLAVAQVESKAKSPTLEIMDASGTVLAVNRGLDSGSDPFLAWKAPADGEYTAVVSNTTMDGSAEHVYRLNIGALPYVTGWSPLTAQAGQETKITLIGHHLGEKATVMMKPDKEGMANVPLDAKTLRFRSQPVLRVNALPQVREADAVAAQSVTLPATIHAALSRVGEVDTFAFDAKKGQQWIIETLAGQAGSPADTKIELLDAQGQPVPRLRMQAMRDSYNNFRSVDANNPDIRLQNWEEMELNEYVWFAGDVMRIVRMPRGPDGGCFFYAQAGMRRAYFDTSATAHSLDEPCYIVEPRALGSQIVANGLPVFTLHYANDDSGDRKLGRDSRLSFTAPADGRYAVRVTDTRGQGGERAVYALTIRQPRPDFSVKLAGADAKVMPGASVGFSIRADRQDGFDDDIVIDITGLPEGYFASSPLKIEAGHDLISGSLHAAADAPAGADWSKVKVTAHARIGSQEVTHTIPGGLGKVTLGAKPKFIIVMEPDVGGKAVMRELKDETKPLEITLVPGQTVKAWIRAVRQGDEGLINLDVHGLPHGVIVDDIGLNGVQIRPKENERPIFFRAAKWMTEREALCHAALSSARNEHDSAGLQTSFPILLKIRKAEVAANTQPKL